MKSITLFIALSSVLVSSSMFAAPPKENGAGSDAYSITDVDALPVVTKQAPPVYPAELRKAHVLGEAKIQFVVDPSGDPTQLVCLSSTAPEFAESALLAVQQWRFHPAQKNGQPVACRMVVPIVFSLSH
ncbi:MAG TPA: TonB family protein [Opitutaceae bacterium]|nr:TonB family protein [Opitutaceae bacterium]